MASPTLIDPNFLRTVVLVLEHSDEGALGLVLNRPTDAAVEEFLSGWETAASDPGVVFLGGPVQREIVVALCQGEAPSLHPVLDWLQSVDLHEDPAVVGPKLDALRVFSGYAGWGAKQLDGEVEQEDWFVLDPRPEDIFSPDPLGLWQRVLRRQRGSLRMVAEFPIEPSTN